MVYSNSIQWPSKAIFLSMMIFGFWGQANSQNITSFNVLPNFGGIDTAGTATINLTTTDGKKVRATSLHPIQNEQYILSLPQIPASQYVLSIESADGTYQQSEIIIKEK